jgi:hypothetical protein
MAHPDTARNVFGPTFIGDLNLIVISGSFTDGAGTVSRDAAASSPGTSVGNAASGVSAVTFTPGAKVVGFSCFLEPPAGAIASQAVLGIPRGVDPAAGTMSVAFVDLATPSPESPVSGTKFYISFYVAQA